MRRAEEVFGRTSLPYPSRDTLERFVLLGTREKLLDVREKLDRPLRVGDGAVGTLLANHGIVEQPPNKADLTYVWSVQDLHEERLGTGTRVMQANTFSVNHIEPTARSLEGKVREINAEGARLTGEAVDSLPRGEDAPKYGVKMVQNLLIEAKSLVASVYLMPSSSMPHLARNVIKPIV